MRRIQVWLSAIAIMLVAACGGGGGDLLSGVGSGGTGGGSSTALGSIRGFGSVIVNGVRYDDLRARIVDDSGASFGRDQLRLGMVVLVQGSVDAAGIVGVADDIRVISEARGLVRSVSVASSSLNVLGLTVHVTPSTVLDGFSGIAAIAAGTAVEVFGFLDPASGAITATRIESEPVPVASFKARGVVGAVDTQQRSFLFGSLVVDYSGADLVGTSGAPTAGAVVSVTSRVSAGGDGRWVVDRVEQVQAPVISSSSVSLEGRISSVTSPASFVLQGIRVDASGARFSGGTVADLANGIRVELTGRIVSGVLVATKVEIEEVEEESGGVEYEIKGLITSIVGPGRFVVRGTTIDANTARIEHGTLQDLRIGLEVEVHGVMESGVVRAIELDIGH